MKKLILSQCNPKHLLKSFDKDSSLFTSAVVLTNAMIVIVSRVGFETDYFVFFSIVGTALLFSNAPVILNSRANIGMNSFYLLILLSLVVLSSFLPHTFVVLILFFFTFLGFATFFILIFQKGASLNTCAIFVWLVLPAILGIWMMGQMHQVEIHHPLYLEKISMGISHIDQLFHATITEMIRNYNVPSTGLYGVTSMKYHVGSHYLFARLSDWFNILALEVYNYVYPILVLPLFIRVSLFLIKDLASLRSTSNTSVKSDWKFWLIFVVLTVGFLPENIRNSFLYLNSWVVSESYTVSLIFLFSGVSMVLMAFGKSNQKGLVITGFIVLPILVFATGFSKISTILVAATSGGYLYLRGAYWKSIKITIYVLLLLVLVIWIIRITKATTQDNLFLLHSIKRYSDIEWRSFFFIIYYFSLLVYTLIRLTSLKLNSFRDLKLALMGNNLLDVEFIWVVAIVGFVPPAILEIDAGSGFYFMDIQIRLSIIFLGSWLLWTLNHANATNRESVAIYLKKNSFVLIIIILLFANNIYARFEDLVNTNLRLRTSIISETPIKSKYYAPGKNVYEYLAGSSKDILPKISEITFLPSEIINKNGYYSFYKWVTDTCKYVSPKRDFYVGIGRVDGYWKTANVVPEAIPFMLPALTGMAQSNGLPENFKELHSYGYIDYFSVGAIDTVNCKPIQGRKILMLVPNQHSIYPCQ